MPIARGKTTQASNDGSFKPNKSSEATNDLFGGTEQEARAAAVQAELSRFGRGHKSMFTPEGSYRDDWDQVPGSGSYGETTTRILRENWPKHIAMPEQVTEALAEADESGLETDHFAAAEQMYHVLGRKTLHPQWALDNARFQSNPLDPDRVAVGDTVIMGNPADGLGAWEENAASGKTGFGVVTDVRRGTSDNYVTIEFEDQDQVTLHAWGLTPFANVRRLDWEHAIDHLDDESDPDIAELETAKLAVIADQACETIEQARHDWSNPQARSDACRAQAVLTCLGGTFREYSDVNTNRDVAEALHGMHEMGDTTLVADRSFDDWCDEEYRANPSEYDSVDEVRDSYQQVDLGDGTYWHRY